MKKNKKSLLLVLSLLVLASCQGGNSSQPTTVPAGDPDRYIEKDPVLAPDTDFQSFDDINVYDNKTRLPF